ncbi:rhodanese-like domain-containing protein [bacterium]|nr:rhodanese-like domain-containing protein [bacterium]
MNLQTIEPRELKAKLSAGSPVILIDVRQLDEYQKINIPGAHLFPLDELAERIDELKQLINNSAAECIVYCRSGKRSQKAIEWLSAQQISGLKNLTGGIEAYRKE